MKQYLLAVSVLLIAQVAAVAQDIPLSKILVDKEGWKEASVPKEFSDPRSASTPNGRYQIDPESKKLVFLPAKGEKDTLKLKLDAQPTCLTLWPDRGHIAIGLADGTHLWAVRIEKDGTFGPGDRYYSLRTDPNRKMHVTAMTMDAAGLLYACTPLGVQIFDPTGRLCGVVPVPTKETLTNIAIGGQGGNQLFVECGKLVFVRKIQGKAVSSGGPSKQ